MVVIITMLAPQTALAMTPPNAAPLAITSAVSEPTEETPSLGHIWFAPVVDGDGNPATNPVEAEPVPVMDLLGYKHGMVTLAAQLEPNNAAQIPVDVPVTFRVWTAEGTIFEQTVQSDAWGAASVQMAPETLVGPFFYEASAPGYAATEVRTFDFDPDRAAYILQQGGAELQYWKQGPGRVLLTLRSSVPLEADRDAVTLFLARAAEGNVAVPLPADIPGLDTDNLYVPFQPVAMQIIDTYTAQIALTLPPGDYRFRGGITSRGAVETHYTSQTLSLEVRGPRPAPEGPAIWVSFAEYAPGYVLAQYQTEAGTASFDLVPADAPPDVTQDYGDTGQITQVHRTGPFSWEEQVYEISIETLIDDGKKQVALHDFEYDPIARRYTLAIRLLQDTPVSDTLRVDVLGPGGVVIQHEDAEVRLYPDRVFYYSIEVPAELGQPYGLRVTLDDPLQAAIEGITAVLKRAHLKFDTTISVMFGLSILSYEFLTLQIECLEGKFACEVNKDASGFQDPVLEAIIAQIVKDAVHSQVISVGAASAGFGLDLGLTQTLNLGPCATEEQIKKGEMLLAIFAADMNLLYEELNYNLVEDINDVISEPVPTPWPPLMWWLGIFAGMSGSVSTDGLTLFLGVNIAIKVRGDVGFGIPWIPDMESLKAMWAVFQYFKGLYDFVRLVQAFGGRLNGITECQLDPPNPQGPDDRQDVWGTLGGFYEAASDEQTIDNLNRLIARAQAQGLWRAERLLTLELRQNELARFQGDTSALNDYLQEIDTLAAPMQATWQGILSGTVPLSPSTTITEAIYGLLDDFAVAAEALSYPNQQQALDNALAVAQRRYEELYGQELELQHELRQLFSANVVGVLATGFAEAPLAVLQDNGIPAQLISPWPSGSGFRGRPAPYFPPALAPRALVIASGGLHPLALSAEGRAWLDAYVAGGGLLIVFTQEFAADWEALPGGEVRGLGYEDATRWQRTSVVPATADLGGAGWLTWLDRDGAAIQVDGAFSAWPEDARLLLTLSRPDGSGTGSVLHDASPVMIEYPYGAGTVLATTTYADWAWLNRLLGWNDDWNMVRSMMMRAYLLVQGKDYDSLPDVELGDTLDVTLTLTNTSTFSTTEMSIQFNPFLEAAAVVPLALEPGESTTFTTTLDTAPYLNPGAYDYTVAGLYRLALVVSTDGGRPYRVFGPLVYVHKTYPKSELELKLVSDCVEAALFDTVHVTATVLNHGLFQRTVVVTGQLDLPTGPAVLIVPGSGGAREVTYTLAMDRGRHAGVLARTSDGVFVGAADLQIALASPNLAATPALPARIDDGATLTMTVTNTAPVYWPIAGSLQLTLTSPSGVALWTGASAVPPLAAGAEVTLPFTLALPALTELGTHLLTYRVDNGAGLSRRTEVPLPRQVALRLTPDPAVYRVGVPLTATVEVANVGHFDLTPTIAVTVPVAGAHVTRTLALPVGDRSSLSLTFTLPPTLTAGTYPVAVHVTQDSATQSRALNIVLPPSRLEAALPAATYQAGAPLTVTLRNAGAVNTVAGYTLRLRDDAGKLVAAQAGTRTVTLNATTFITLEIPASAADGAYYVAFNGEDQLRARPFSLLRELDVTGVRGMLDVRPNQESYQEYEDIAAVGTVTATQGHLKGMLALDIVGAADALPSTIEMVNDDPDDRNQTTPALAVDGTGQRFAVWVDNDGAIIFRSRSAQGAWSMPEMVASGWGTWIGLPDLTVDTTGRAYATWVHEEYSGNLSVHAGIRSFSGQWNNNTVDPISDGQQTAPSIAVDTAGSAYIVWQDTRDDSGDIRFAYQPVDEWWTGYERINDDSGTNWQGTPDLAVDAAGNLYAVWADARNGEGDNDIYFATRPAGGEWNANEVVADAAGSLENPRIAVDGDGGVHVVWQDSVEDTIYYATRLGTGVWSTPEQVCDDEARANDPALTVGPQGQLFVTWLDYRINGGEGGSEIFVAERVDGVWSADVNVNDYPLWIEQQAPAIAADPLGNVTLVWQDTRGGTDDIYFAERPLGGAWSTNTRVGQSGGAASKRWPDFAVDAEGGGYALWIDNRSEGYDLFFRYRTPAGVWQPSEQVNLSTGPVLGYSRVAIDVDAAGRAYAVWASDVPFDVYFAVRSITGTWGLEERVNDDIGSAERCDPDIAVDDAGNAYVIWSDSRDDVSDIFFAYRSASGVWSSNEKVHPDASGDYQAVPAITVDASSNAYAVWEDESSLDDEVDIYAAVRPANGSWSPREMVNDDGIAGRKQSSPDIAVSPFGYAYAVWEDERTADWQVYFAERPPDGAWDTNVRLDDAPKTYPSHPSIALNDRGDLAVAWVDKRNASETNADLYFTYRLAGETWSPNLQANDAYRQVYGVPAVPVAALDTTGTLFTMWSDERFGQDFFLRTFDLSGGDVVLYSDAVGVNTTITQTIDRMLTGFDPGQYWLDARLLTGFGQPLGEMRTPFVVHPDTVRLELATDRPSYRPGETLTVTVSISNPQGTALALPLTVTVGSTTLLTQTVNLDGYGETAYTVSAVVSDSVVVRAATDVYTIAQWVRVTAPQVAATLVVPPVVGHDPFSATLWLTNTGAFPADVLVRMTGGLDEGLVLAPGNSTFHQVTLALTDTLAVTATVRGDVILNLSQLVACGERAALWLAPVTPGATGDLAIAYAVTHTGSLAATFNLVYQLDDGAPVTVTYPLTPGQAIAEELLLAAAPGPHTLAAEVRAESGALLTQTTLPIVALAAGEPALPEITVRAMQVQPHVTGAGAGNAPLPTGQPLDLILELFNAGASAPIIVTAQLFGLREQWIVTPTGGTVETFVLPLTVPDDLPGGEIIGEVIVDGRFYPLTLELEGPQVAMTLALDRSTYAIGDVVHLTVTLTETAGLGGDYVVEGFYVREYETSTVTLAPGGVGQATFAFTATEAARASVFLGNPPTANAARLILMLDSLPVPVVDPASGAYLTFDKLVYAPGDTLYLTATITGTHSYVWVQGPLEGFLWEDGIVFWSAPTVNDDGLRQVPPGSYALSYTLPASVPMGRYTFALYVGGHYQTYPVDVAGWHVTTRHVLLDKPHYNTPDTLAATVEFLNHGDAAITGLSLRAWVYPPDDGDLVPLEPPVSRTVTLQPGLNVITVTGAFTSPVVGPHRLLVNLGTDCCGRIAGAATQFDVGQAHIVALTTDHGIYAPGAAGTGRLDIYGFGATRLVVTATNGSTLLDSTPELTGFHSYIFAIPTTDVDDYLLVGQLTNGRGNQDRRVHAYAVPAPRDTQPPMLTLTVPATRTVITTAAPTLTLAVQGTVTDAGGAVTVLVNGQVVTPTDEAFATTVTVRQGYNLIYATAFDASGNVTYAPPVAVLLLPAHGVTLTTERIVALIGETITLQAVLTASGTLSNTALELYLPASLVGPITPTYGSGEAALMMLEDWRGMSWRGALTAAEPVTVAVHVPLLAPGVFTQTAEAFWGMGFSDTSASAVVTALDTVYDLSDAATSYALAWHTPGALRLGTTVDSDASTTPGHDDTTDDGVTFAPDTNVTPGEVVTLDVEVQGGTGYLAGWIDWDQDGGFAPTAELVVAQSIAVGANAITFTVPATYTTGTPLVARFRLYASAPENLAPTGPAEDGEVEDYDWMFTPTAVNLYGVTVINGRWQLWVGMLMLGVLILVIERRRASSDRPSSPSSSLKSVSVTDSSPTTCAP